MDNNLLLMFLIIHILADFYFQNEKLANNKNQNIGHLLLHCLYYIVIGLVLMALFLSKEIIIYTLIFGGAHLLIDVIKFVVVKIIGRKEELSKHHDRLIYLADQLLHIVAIVVIAEIFIVNYVDISRWSLFGLEGELPNDALRNFIALLLIFKPTNITFKKFFSHVKPTDEGNDGEDLSIGKVIGNLERMLVLILLYLNQYTAIGLVFTAKSITRYDKITREQEFAEYYLLGTLYSILSTLLIYIIIKV